MADIMEPSKFYTPQDYLEEQQAFLRAADSLRVDLKNLLREDEHRAGSWARGRRMAIGSALEGLDGWVAVLYERIANARRDVAAQEAKNA